jgi:DNA helicase-2/ATP-dependent DNA helicase PcrA
MGGAVTSALLHNQKNIQGDSEFALGQRVIHAKFGEGVVLNMEGAGDNIRVHVNFEQAGNKWLVAAYAGLEPA